MWYWLFVGSERAGRRAAVLTSLIASCKSLEVEPWAYLKDLFSRLAYKPDATKLSNLLPDLWLADNPVNRWQIAEVRKKQRM